MHVAEFNQYCLYGQWDRCPTAKQPAPVHEKAIHLTPVAAGFILEGKSKDKSSGGNMCGVLDGVVSIRKHPQDERYVQVNSMGRDNMALAPV